MASGDAQRRWFPEMIALLRVRWRPELSWPEVVALRDDLDIMLRETRDRFGILPPMMRCPRCGEVQRSQLGPLSVRAVILAAGRFGIAEPDEVESMEKRWASHRKAARLDLVGRPETTGRREGPRCDRAK